jgi:hypothetical protein
MMRPSTEFGRTGTWEKTGSDVTIRHGGTPPARLELCFEEIEVLLMVR